MGPEFWAEPWNTLSTGSFFISAILLVVLLRFTGHGDWRAYTLSFGVFSLGIASFLNHTLSVSWTMWIDIVCVMFFQISLLTFYCRDVMMRNLRQVLIIDVVFISCSIGAIFIPYSVFQGAGSYLVTLTMFTWLGAWHYKHIHPGKNLMMMGTIAFAVGFLSRTIDDKVCEIFAPGSHFLWHICAAVFLYFVVRAYVLGRSVILRPDASILQENELLEGN